MAININSPEEELKKAYDELVKKALLIKEAFVNYYTDERVDYDSIYSFEDFKSLLAANVSITDLKNKHFNIIVHFPEVTVTNEQNQSHTIYHVYCKTQYGYNGKLNINPVWTRTHYTAVEAYHYYIHSHIQYMPRHNNEWSECCLGSGPIRNTILQMHTQFDIDAVNLYCFELDKYIQTESLSGGPYIHLSALTNYYTRDYNSEIYCDRNNSFDSIYYSTFDYRDSTCQEIIKSAIYLLLQNKQLTFVHNGNSINLNCSDVDFALMLSDAFIFVYKKYVEKGMTDNLNELTNVCMIENNELVIKTTRVRNIPIPAWNNNILLTFKGEEKRAHITAANENLTEKELIVLQPNLVVATKNLILSHLNLTYGNQTN